MGAPSGCCAIKAAGASRAAPLSCACVIPTWRRSHSIAVPTKATSGADSDTLPLESRLVRGPEPTWSTGGVGGLQHATAGCNNFALRGNMSRGTSRTRPSALPSGCSSSSAVRARAGWSALRDDPRLRSIGRSLAHKAHQSWRVGMNVTRPARVPASDAVQRRPLHIRSCKRLLGTSGTRCCFAEPHARPVTHTCARTHAHNDHARP
jgi:hypothetical protein